MNITSLNRTTLLFEEVSPLVGFYYIVNTINTIFVKLQDEFSLFTETTCDENTSRHSGLNLSHNFQREKIIFKTLEPTLTYHILVFFLFFCHSGINASHAINISPLIRGKEEIQVYKSIEATKRAPTLIQQTRPYLQKSA